MINELMSGLDYTRLSVFVRKTASDKDAVGKTADSRNFVIICLVMYMLRFRLVYYLIVAVGNVFTG